MDWNKYIKDAIPSKHSNTLYLNKEIADLDQPGPKDYMWTDIDDYLKLRFKEGRTKNLAADRVSGYEAKKRKVITDIIVDPAFKDSKSDQQFNSFRSEGDYPAILVRDAETTTQELLEYDTFDHVLNASALRREYLQKWLKDDSAGRIDELDFRFTSADVINKYWEFTKTFERKDPTIGFQIDTRGGKELLQIVLGLLSKKKNIFFGSDFYASFGGLIKSIYKFVFFQDVAVIDLRTVKTEANIKELYNKYSKQGKAIAWIVGLSKINHPIDAILKKIGDDKITFVDEIDWSAFHKEAYIKKLAKGGPLILLSADLNKAKAKFDFDQIIELPYEEMLIMAKYSQEDPSYSKPIINEFYKNFPELEKNPNFSIQPVMEGLVEPVFVDISLADEGIANDLNWNVINNDLNKHGKIYADIQDILIANGNTPAYSKFNLKNILARVNELLAQKGLNVRVDENNPTPIEFTTAKSNDQIKKQQQIKQTQVGNRYKVITATGEDLHIKDHSKQNIKQGQKVTRETAAQYVEDHFELAQQEGYANVWVLSKFIIQRSYSIHKHNVTLLSYDDSSESTGKQWIARGWTPGQGKEVAVNIHVHFNRSQSPLYMSMILQQAQKLKARHKISIERAIKQVLLKLTFLQIDDNGDPKEYTYDSFMRSVAMRNPSTKAVALDFASYIAKNFSQEVIDHIMNGHKGSVAVGNRKVEVYKKLIQKKKGSKGVPSKPSDVKNLEKVLMVFFDQLDVVVPMADSESFDIRKVLQKIDSDSILSEEFESSFGFQPGIMSMVLEDNSLDQKIEQLNFYTLKKISITKQAFVG